MNIVAGGTSAVRLGYIYNGRKMRSDEAHRLAPVTSHDALDRNDSAWRTTQAARPLVYRAEHDIGEQRKQASTLGGVSGIRAKEWLLCEEASLHVQGIHRDKHTYDPERPFRPWMYAIARHQLSDHVEKQ